MQGAHADESDRDRLSVQGLCRGLRPLSHDALALRRDAGRQVRRPASKIVLICEPAAVTAVEACMSGQTACKSSDCWSFVPDGAVLEPSLLCSRFEHVFAVAK